MSNNIKQEDGWENWRSTILKYVKPSPWRSIWQLINSFVPFFALLVAMYYSLSYSYWITIALAIPAAGFLVRIFIIFHDCGHGSFFTSKRANEIVGIIAGLMVYTPYHRWHFEHQRHHQTVGNLDKRGMGDVFTMTVEEYKEASASKKFWYRMYRYPILLLLIVPFLLFTVVYRLQGEEQGWKVHWKTHLTTIVLILIVTGISLLIGFKTFLLIQVPVLLIASITGVWLFYVQHQYKDVTWERTENWKYHEIAMQGSSFYKLPRIFQFFSGNIGFHHIHHLGPKIPNYYLEKCHKENPIFQKEPLTFGPSFESIKYRLWDEDKGRLVSYKEAGV
jgi:omega-6 fatty acid desaturase (delta-12 desaturase)